MNNAADADTVENKVLLGSSMTVYLSWVNDLIHGVIIQKAMLTEAYGVQQHNAPMHNFDDIYNRPHPLVQQVQHVFSSAQYSTVGPLMFAGNDWAGKHILIKTKTCGQGRTYFPTVCQPANTCGNVSFYYSCFFSVRLFQDVPPSPSLISWVPKKQSWQLPTIFTGAL